MGDKPNNESGSTPTAEQTAAAEQQAAEQATAEALEAFGYKPAPKDGDPEKKDEAEPTPGDLDKGTTPKTSSEADGKGSDKPPEPKKRFFGKYDSEEAAELGYTNLVQHKTTLETENREYRERLAKAEADLKSIKESKPAASTETTSKEKFLANPTFKAVYEADVDTYGQEGADLRLKRDIELFNLAEPRKSEPDPEVQELIKERTERQLMEKYPELKPDGKARQTFYATIEQLRDDPSLERFTDVVAKAALMDHVPEIVENAYKRGRAEALKEIKDKGIAGTLTADSAAPRTTEAAKSDNDKHREALLAFLPADDPRVKALE